MEIGNLVEVIEASKTDNDDDDADTLTDIDELLRDKLREGELVAVVESEQIKEDVEVIHVNTENEVSVDVISTSASTEEDNCTEDEEIKAEDKEIVDNMADEIKTVD